MIVQVNPDGQSRLVPVLVEMLEQEELCDFTIKSGTKFVKAHKCILAATLEYFRTSFRFSEACSYETSIDLSHLNLDIMVVQRVIQSLYRNEIDLNQDIVEGVLVLADYLLYKDLIICVERFMENTLGLSNAIFYFKLCILYNLCSTSLFGNVRRILRGRFHDYLIYESGNLKLDMDVYGAMHSYGMLDNSTPLQLMTFFLKKLQQDLLSRNEKCEKDLLGITNFLETLFSYDRLLLKCWKPYLLDFFNEWLRNNEQHFVNYDTLLKTLRTFGKKFLSGQEIQNGLQKENNYFEAKAENISQGDHDALDKNPIVSNAEVCTSSATSESKLLSQSQNSQSSGVLNLSTDTASKGGSEEVYNPQNDENLSLHLTLSSPHHCGNSFPNLTVPDQTSTANKDQLCQTLVVLAPSSEMAFQLMEVEGGRLRPLLKAPRLCLHLYDVQLRMWREGIILDFPIPGYMLEKHSWRLAFANGNLYLFSLGKKVGLEYSLAESSWTHLQCEELFKAHNNSIDEAFPVKSVIPVSIADELVVLSMSREPRPDGSYWTQQHIYQFDQNTKTFSHITVVRDERMDLPITKWTVNDDNLFTLKASTVMYSNLHVYNVQHIHIYNAKARQLKTHHVQSAMKSGLKVLVQAGQLYMLNNLGEYQQLDLATSKLSDWRRISNPAFTTVNSSVTDRTEIYPALLRTTCHAGCSRWTVSSQDNIGSASLQQMFINEDGEFKIGHHPSPPFLYLTAMCVAKVRRGILDQLKQARFDASTLVPS